MFQSTRPMRGATEWNSYRRSFAAVSIHAPHAGRDGQQAIAADRVTAVSIHAPHAGRDMTL